MYLTFLAASDVKLGDAALYSLIGFLIVFAVLALLVGIFYLMGAIFRSIHAASLYLPFYWPP